MKTFCIAVLTLGVLTLGAVAQTSAGASASGSGSVSAGQSGTNAGAGANAGSSAQVNGASAGNASAGLSSGTTLQAELTKPLDAKKSQSRRRGHGQTDRRCKVRWQSGAAPRIKAGRACHRSAGPRQGRV